VSLCVSVCVSVCVFMRLWRLMICFREVLALDDMIVVCLQVLCACTYVCVHVSVLMICVCGRYACNMLAGVMRVSLCSSVSVSVSVCMCV